jgi:hypothetical protein
MDPYNTLIFLVIGLLLGAVGQLFRVFIGLKKEWDEAGESAANYADQKAKLKNKFDSGHLLISVLFGVAIGACAGILGAAQYVGKDLTTDTLMAMFLAGYAGSDFIEGLVTKYK